jgi:hypothetical protein
MNELGNVKVVFVAGFGPIVRDAVASRRLYGEALGVRLKEETGGYLHTDGLEGAKTFALWPLSQAAQSCFGKDSWLAEIPAPQGWLELDVDSVWRGRRRRSRRAAIDAREEQEGAVGTDRQPVLVAGRTAPRDHVHAVDARREHLAGCRRRAGEDRHMPYETDLVAHDARRRQEAIVDVGADVAGDAGATDPPAAGHQEAGRRGASEIVSGIRRHVRRAQPASIPPERLLKSMLLMALYTVRRERQRCEQLDYNLSSGGSSTRVSDVLGRRRSRRGGA